MIENRRRILALQPHPVKLSGEMVHFETSIVIPLTIIGSGNVTICGKNLFNAEIEQGGFNSSTGNETTSNTRIRSKPILLNAGTYTVSSNPNKNVIVYIYDENDNFISSELINVWSVFPRTFTISNRRHVRFIWRNTNSSSNIVPSDISSVQVELNSTATDYEPFTGTSSANLIDKKSLIGINNIWSDSGDIIVKYWTY